MGQEKGKYNNQNPNKQKCRKHKISNTYIEKYRNTETPQNHISKSATISNSNFPFYGSAAVLRTSIFFEQNVDVFKQSLKNYIK